MSMLGKMMCIFSEKQNSADVIIAHNDSSVINSVSECVKSQEMIKQSLSNTHTKEQQASNDVTSVTLPGANCDTINNLSSNSSCEK